MKKLILAVLILFSVHNSFSQISSDSTGDVDLYTEKFADSSGTLIQKEYIRVGNILDCTIWVVHYTYLITGEKASALRFVDEAGKQAYLDPHEVDVLATSMKTVREKVLNTSPANYTEAFYRNMSGFEAGSYYTKGQWTSYLELRRHDRSSITTMKKGDLDIFLRILDIAKTKL